MKRLMDTIDHALTAIAMAPGRIPPSVATSHLEVLLQREWVGVTWDGGKLSAYLMPQGVKELEKLLTPGMPADAKSAEPRE